MVAEEQSAEGSFRHQHSRLRSNAEAVAFLEGGKAEERILNKSFGDLYRLRSLFALKRCELIFIMLHRRQNHLIF